MGAAWSRCKLLIECDNQNSVCAINTGMSHNLLMQKILHNIHLECSLKSVEVRAVFVFGCVNMQADCLSRFHLHENFRKLGGVCNRSTSASACVVVHYHLINYATYMHI